MFEKLPKELQVKREIEQISTGTVGTIILNGLGNVFITVILFIREASSVSQIVSLLRQEE